MILLLQLDHRVELLLERLHILLPLDDNTDALAERAPLHVLAEPTVKFERVGGKELVPLTLPDHLELRTVFESLRLADGGDGGIRVGGQLGLLDAGWFDIDCRRHCGALWVVQKSCVVVVDGDGV